MSRFHAGFSLGTVTGALVGAAMVAGGVSVTTHLVVAAVVLVPSVIVAATRFLPEHDHDHSAVAMHDPSSEAPESSKTALQVERRGAFAAWREPRTLLIGTFVLAFAFAEGVANDWIAVAVIDDHHASEAVGTLAFAVFLASMTVARWFGPALLDRYGRVAVVRTMALVGIAGTTLFVLAPVTWLALGGVALWGLGAVPWISSRHERGRGRAGAGREPRERGLVDRLLRVPRGPAPDRVPRRPDHGIERARQCDRPPRLAAVIAPVVQPRVVE